MKAPAQKQNASGGSTLKRLKTTLKTAGLIGPQKAAAKKAAKATATRPSALAQKADAILQSLRSNNPFELKVQKTKHDVLGRKLKGSQGRPGLTRQKGLESRKQALLTEIAKRNHVGGIVDRRIGEHDPNMTEEEKMMLRWTREKQRAAQAKKSNPFNLDDDGNEFDGLTHLGKSIDDLDNFNDFGPSDDDDADGALAREYSRAMFGGGSGDHAQKSKADVMKELIAKSKQHKAERQKIKEENEDLRLQLDSELDSIRGLLMGGGGAAQAAPRKGVEDEYDMMVRELKFDKRAQPTDRTKTEEELAVEEKERLERLEKDRLRRMNGEDPAVDSDLTATGGYRARRERKKREEELAIGGDDGSDFGSDDELNGNVAVDRFGNASEGDATLTYSADGETMVSKSIFVKKRKASEMSDDDESGSDDDETNSQGESDQGADSDVDGDADLQVSGSDVEGGSDHDDDDDDAESDSNVDGSDSNDSDIWSDDEDSGVARRNHSATKAARSTLTEAQRTEMMLKAKEELPYTFPAPLSQDDFDQLMAGRSIEQVVELMGRFRKLYHPSLGPENKTKQSKNLGFLMNYMWNLDVEEELSASDVRAAFDRLYPTVVEMSKAFPMALAQWVSDMLGTLLGPSIAPPTDFSAANLFCFKLLGNVFSVSDFHHAVVTPMLLTIASYLVRPPRSMSEAATGLFLTGFCIESQSLSKRWMPEVFNYLTRIVSVYSSSSAGHFPTMDLLPAGPISLEPSALHLGQVSPMPKNAHSSLLMVALRQLRELDHLYSGSLDSLPELYEPVIDILHQLPATTPLDAPTTTKKTKSSRKSASSSNTMHPSLARARDDLVASMEQHIVRVGQRRRALQLQKHRPVAIPMAEPQFDEHYSLDRKYRDDPNTDVESEKLKAQYKKEKKGAIRELRRDAEFLAQVRVKEQRRKDKEYEAKMRRIEGKLGDEIGELKKMKRETKKRKLV